MPVQSPVVQFVNSIIPGDQALNDLVVATLYRLATIARYIMHDHRLHVEIAPPLPSVPYATWWPHVHLPQVDTSNIQQAL